MLSSKFFPNQHKKLMAIESANCFLFISATMKKVIESVFIKCNCDWITVSQVIYKNIHYKDDDIENTCS